MISTISINFLKIITALILLFMVNGVYANENCQNIPEYVCDYSLHPPLCRWEDRHYCGRGTGSAKCGNIYVKNHTEYPKGHQWKVCTNYKFIFQKDGNLVVYNPKDKAVWSSNTHKNGAEFLAMQSDGNLVIYNKHSQPIWASNTHGNRGAVLAIQDDGNVVIYNANEKAIWSTGTHGK